MENTRLIMQTEKTIKILSRQIALRREWLKKEPNSKQAPLWRTKMNKNARMIRYYEEVLSFLTDVD